MLKSASMNNRLLQLHNSDNGLRSVPEVFSQGGFCPASGRSGDNALAAFIDGRNIGQSHWLWRKSSA